MTITPSIATYRDTCRVSGKPLYDVFDMGPIHLSAFLRPDEPDPPAVPLTLAYEDESGLAQLRHSVQPDQMFRTYWYRSGTNEMMRAHLEGIAEQTTKWVNLKPGDTVLDIGCNDGTMLGYYPEGVYRVGCDPSEVQPQNTDAFVNDYFNAAHFKPHSFKAVTSIAMLYDVEDPVQFARDVATVLAEDGVWVTEQHYLHAMLQSNGFDAICHEHLTYLDLRALEHIVKQAGLGVQHVELSAANGGSFRAFIGHGRKFYGSDTLREFRRREPEWPDFEGFRKRVELNKEATMLMLESIRMHSGADPLFPEPNIGGLGASTKLNSVLQYYGITRHYLPWIAERMPEKVGLVTAGSRIPIISEEAARRKQPKYFFVGPYHFIEALVRRESEFVRSGGRFLVPIPHPRLVA